MLTVVTILLVASFGLAAAAFVTGRVRGSAPTVAEMEGFAGPVPGALGEFVAVLNRVGSEDDPDYVAGLERIRRDKAGFLADAARILAAMPAGVFALRHSVVLAVSALRDADALDLLGTVALNPQPLPPGLPDGRGALPAIHGAEDVVQGTVVALGALDGIERLAEDGHARALDLLAEATRVESNAIRGAALTALAALPTGREHLQRAVAGLPPELRSLAALRRVDVRDVPQIRDPRIHLLEEGTVVPAPSLPEDAGSRPGVPAPPVRGAPLIRRR